MPEILSIWPNWSIHAVHAVKAVFGWFSHRTLLGIPADWLLRAALLGALYAILSRRWPRGRAATLCAALLVTKEIFDIFATRHPLHPPLPDAGDLADIASGLAGLFVAELLFICRYPKDPGQRMPDD